MTSSYSLGFFKKTVILFCIFLFFLIIPSPLFALTFNAECLPSGCTDFAGPLISFTFVPPCGQVIVVGLPKPITAVYFGSRYLYNPPIPIPPGKPGKQNVLGRVNNFNPNILCPLPRVL